MEVSDHPPWMVAGHGFPLEKCPDELLEMVVPSWEFCFCLVVQFYDGWRS